MRARWIVTGLSLLALGLLSCEPESHSAPAASAADAGSVRIEKKTEVLKREGKEAVVRYPVFEGLPPAVLKELRSSAGLKAGTESSLEEWKAEFQDSWWLSEIDYEVTYNRNGLLSLTYSVSGVGAYPDTSTKDIVVDLKTGRRLTAKDAFRAGSLEDLAAKVDRMRAAAVERAIHRAEMTDEDVELAMGPVRESRFGIESLDRFRLGEKGITFVYDFGFPHVSEALEPAGEYFLGYEELRPFVNPEGPLGRVVR